MPPSQARADVEGALGAPAAVPTRLLFQLGLGVGRSAPTPTSRGLFYLQPGDQVKVGFSSVE